MATLYTCTDIRSGRVNKGRDPKTGQPVLGEPTYVASFSGKDASGATVNATKQGIDPKAYTVGNTYEL